MSALDRKSDGDRRPDWINLVLGIALFASPWLLGYADGTIAAWSACYAGGFVTVLAFYALANFAPWHEWAQTAAGLATLLAPFALGFGGVPLWVHVAAGAAVAALAGWRAWSVQHGGTDLGTHAPA